MRRRILSFALLIGLSIISLIGLTSCGNDEQPTGPEQLIAPIITLVDDTATWEVNSNAEKFEISLSGELSYVENTYVSKKLTDGQSLKVRAIGDGIKYTTSEWSNVVSYTASVDSHTCDFTGTWKTDGTYHWHECTCGETDTKVAHSGGTATETEKAVCEVCGASYGDYKAPDHTHEATGDWKSDDTHHWKECSCGAPDEKVAHTYDQTVIGDNYFATSADCDDDATYYYSCVCGAKGTQTFTAVDSKLGHDWAETWSHDETDHWHECERDNCDAIDLKEEHSGGTATETEKAVCEACGQVYGELLEDNPTTTTAPTYIDITASSYEPDPEEVRQNIQVMALSRSMSLEDSLRAFLSDSENSLGDTAPTASNYEIYSRSSNVVYIQIWLDNPDQNTILSLKLNGTKYQSGGALQSFFVEYGESYLNCVYVAVTIPANSYEEITYEVTEIEYVEGSNISQDGKAVLIDEDNDTVVIGLPYEESLPTATISNVVPTASTVTFDVNVSDEDGYVELVGGWLRVVIYNNNNEIIGQSKLTLGNNSVTFENLSADTSYNIMAFVLGDAHDGNGVYVHGLANENARTKSVISCELESKILFNEETNKYYPQIIVNATLADTSFNFTKVEVIRDYSTVVFTSDFEGSIEITENILNGREYIVKVYYKNSSNIEQSYQDYVYVDGLDYPNINFDSNSSYGLVDDAIMGLECNDGKYNIDNLTVKIFDEKSAQYIAESALYLLDNPTAISDLETLYNSLPFGSDEWAEAYDSWYKLSNIQETIDQYHSTLTRTDWENALAKDIYLYEFTYGVDDEFFKGANNRYYVVLPDYQTKRIHDNSWQYIITGVVDNNDEQEVVDRELSSGWFEINPALTENDYLFTEYSYELGKDLFYIDENNVLYLQTMSRNNLGDETYRALGYVNQIALRTYDEFVKVLWTQDAADTTIDEAAWLEDMKAAFIAGEDPHSAFPLGDLELITFDLDDIDLSDVTAGNYYICYTYIMYGKEYTVENPYDTDGNWLDYAVDGKLPKASINIKTSATEDYGTFEIVIPKSANNGNWNSYTIEVRNDSEELIGTYNQDDYGEIGTLSANYSIRIKLTADSSNDYYTDGEWSEWFVCSQAKCDTPTNLSQYYTEDGVTVSWDYVNGSEKYVYKVNDDEEQETSETSVVGLKNGDTIKVKAVPATDSTYLESDYSEVYTVEDTRTPLASPIVTFESDYDRIVWEAVENAASYQVYDVTNSTLYRTTTSFNCYIEIGNVYIVKAIPSDYDTYCGSQSEEVNTTVKFDTPEITISETGVVSFTEYYYAKCEVTYVYVVNSGEEQTTTNCWDVVTLTAGDTIKVKVTCSETGYVDSEWATATYLAEAENQEPAHIETTVADLVNNKPTEEKTVIYEVTAYWILKDGGSTYGNGWLNDGNGNEIVVYGLCSDSSVLTYAEGVYTFQNNQSYSSLNLTTGAIIKVGMVYSTQYDNYMCYVIEVVDMVESVSIADFNENFDSYKENHVAVTGVIYAADKYGLFIKDNNNNSLYVSVSYSNISIGQTVTFTGVANQYFTLPELKCATYTRGEMTEYELTVNTGTIEEFITINNSQTNKVLTHNVYRLTGVLTQEEDNYFLVDGDYKVQIKSSTIDSDFANLTSYNGKKISVNVVLSDCFTTTGIFRVIPLVGEEANVEEIIENKLAMPVLTVSKEGLVSWEAIPNATSYEYYINENEVVITNELSVQLSEGDTIYVKALADGVNYQNSDCASITYSGNILKIAEINENIDSYTETSVKVKGTVYARDLYGFFIIDENQDTLYIKYNYAIDAISISQSVTVVGTTNVYYSLPQFVATEVILGDIVNFDMTLYQGTIAQVLDAVADQSTMVYNHDAFRVSGVLTLEDSNYFLVDGDYKLQFKSSMWDVENNLLTQYIDQNISINVVLYDCFTTTGIFRVIPLPGTDMNIVVNKTYEGKLATPVLIISEAGLVSWEAVENAAQYMYKINDGELQSTQELSVQLAEGDSIAVRAMGDGSTYESSEWSDSITYVNSNSEPAHIETTISNLVNNIPTEDKTVIYEVTATWVLKSGGETYGNGWLKDDNGNQITVYGLCADDSVISWSDGVYTYVNNKSYSSAGIVDGAVITVGMVYSLGYDNYCCYLIEIVATPEVEEPATSINFIMINDTHGAFTDSSEGYSIGRVDSLVTSLETTNGDYIFIHNGDAFQGSYVCGKTYGLAMIEALNASGVDCFVIGNHEFDWGIDKIAAYKDGNLENGEANFPFLGANIYYKGTTTRPDWIDAYTIVEQDGLKVGIIGVIGEDQEGDILTRYVTDYEFVDPVSIIETTAAYLRDTEGCSVVVVATHDYTPTENTEIGQLSGSSRIDAIFCAHTHQNITESVTRSDSKSIPVVQCNHKNNNAAEVVLYLNEENEYTSFYTEKHYPNSYSISSDVQTIISSYQDLIDESNEVIGTVDSELGKTTLGAYAVDAMLNTDYSSYNFEGVDIAIMNTGGVRASIDSGDITRAEVFEVFPFENAVVLVNISGALIKDLYGNNSTYMYMDIDDSIGDYTLLDDDIIYQLAVIDYVFENVRYNQFDALTEEDYIQTDCVLRDLLMVYLDAAY